MKKMMVLLFMILTLLIISACEPVQSITVEVINLNEEVLFTKRLRLDLENETTLLSFLNENIDLDYTEFSFGVFVNGIEGHYPTEYQVTYNYYFGLYVNNEASTVGISEIEIIEGMTVSFIEQTMLDETDLKVDQIIYQFLDTYLDTYITNEDIHAHVFAATWQLSYHNYQVPEGYDLTASTSSTVESIGRETLGQLLKTVLFEVAFKQDLEVSTNQLLSFEIQNHYEALTVLTLQSLLNFSSEDMQSTISFLTTSTPDYMDSDYAGMVLLALSNHIDLEGVEPFINDMILYIKDQQSENGITAWGSANSASTAVVILGLLAQNIDPRSEAFTVQDVDLIEALLTYEVNNAFKWIRTQDTIDLAFSTPQAFAALVAYKIYRDTFVKTAFDLFNLN
jgi:hypothetical protein